MAKGKSDLVKAVADATGLNKAVCSKALDAFYNAVSETLASKDSVVIPGFGKFYILTREARKGRNPRTGEIVDIPAGLVPRFKAGKALKEAVKGA